MHSIVIVVVSQEHHRPLTHWHLLVDRCFFSFRFLFLLLLLGLGLTLSIRPIHSHHTHRPDTPKVKRPSAPTSWSWLLRLFYLFLASALLSPSLPPGLSLLHTLSRCVHTRFYNITSLAYTESSRDHCFSFFSDSVRLLNLKPTASVPPRVLRFFFPGLRFYINLHSLYRLRQSSPLSGLQVVNLYTASHRLIFVNNKSCLLAIGLSDYLQLYYTLLGHPLVFSAQLYIATTINHLGSIVDFHFHCRSGSTKPTQG